MKRQQKKLKEPQGIGNWNVGARFEFGHQPQILRSANHRNTQHSSDEIVMVNI